MCALSSPTVMPRMPYVRRARAYGPKNEDLCHWPARDRATSMANLLNATMHAVDVLSEPVVQTIARDVEDSVMIFFFFWAMYLMVQGCIDQDRREQMQRAVKSSGKWLRESFAKTSQSVRRLSTSLLGLSDLKDSQIGKKDPLAPKVDTASRRAMV